MPVIEILSPRHEADLLQTKEIFLAYAKAINIDLCFQDFDTELANLPGDYSPPRGALLLAWVDQKLAGCCAMRPIDSSDYANAAEMKRLFVRPEFRGLGLGRQLAESIIDAARMSGYDSVLLDTLDDMEIARAMYEDLGFKEIPPYYHNPLAGAHYLKVDL
ncbi:MAG: GNAT family N-acetyltransferase [Polaromonas sp.]|jgi:ribosomal protein S18 acetylase RimI-like enzyme|nr:GNAT family N-acetyltransferase [Polaromonas sp.]MBK9341319.1 GNAT family N-acetyltransferase [Rhodoferax sp.]